MKDFVEIVKVPFHNVSFSRLMVGLRFCATLLIVQVLRNILVRVVQLPEIEARELAEFMHTYIETYESSLTTCLVFHPPDFAILKSIVNDRLFF